MKERKIAGIKVIVNDEQYEAYKGTLQDQIKELQDRIDKAIEYIKNNCYDDNQLCNGLWEEIPELLNILKGSDNNE